MPLKYGSTAICLGNSCLAIISNSKAGGGMSDNATGLGPLGMGGAFRYGAKLRGGLRCGEGGGFSVKEGMWCGAGGGVGVKAGGGGFGTTVG